MVGAPLRGGGGREETPCRAFEADGVTGARPKPRVGPVYHRRGVRALRGVVAAGTGHARAREKDRTRRPRTQLRTKPFLLSFLCFFGGSSPRLLEWHREESAMSSSFFFFLPKIREGVVRVIINIYTLIYTVSRET